MRGGQKYADKVKEGIGQMLTSADKGGRGIYQILSLAEKGLA